MDFYAKTIVDEYNLKMDKLIIYNCPCYNEYVYEESKRVDGEDVIRLLLKYNKSYAACIQLHCSNNQVIVKHKVLPIMIGSKIDMMIRPNVDFKHQLGAFVLNGGIKILPAFITNNLRCGHVYRPSNEYKWYLNEDVPDDANSTIVHMIQYPPNVAESPVVESGSRRRRKGNSTIAAVNTRVKLVSTKRMTEKRVGVRGYAIKDDCIVADNTDEEIFALINRLSPVNAITDNAHTVTPEDYIDFFECSINNYPELDDLCNKTIITPTSIFETAIKKWSTLPQNSSKLGTLVSGNLFYTLSSKTVSYIKNDEFKTAYLSVEGHRVSMIDKLISTVKRHINHGVKNSNALKLPRDSSNFICPLNVKEMKNAGETMALAQFVMIAPAVSLERIVDFLNDHHSPEAELRVVIEGWLTNYRIRPCDVIEMKRAMIVVTMVYEDRYLVVYHVGHLPVKYSPKYRMFVGVHEAMNTYRDAFEGYTSFAAYTTFAMNFHRALLHMPPAKATVSINNIKGSCSTLTSRSDLHAFIHSIGFTNSAVMTTNIGMLTDCDDDRENERQLGEEFECVSFNDSSKFMLAIKAAATKFTHLAEIQPECKEYYMEAPETVHEFFKDYNRLKRENLAITDGRADLLDPCMVGAKTFEEEGQCYRDLFVHDADEHFECIQRQLSTIKMQDYNVLPVPPGSTSKRDESRYEECMQMNLDTYSNTNRMLLYTALCNLNCDSVEDGIIIDENFHRNSPLKLFSVTLLLRVYAHTDDKSTFSHKAMSLKPNGTYKYIPINKKFDGVIVFGVLITDHQVRIQRRRSVYIHKSFIKNTFRYLITMSDPLRKSKTIDSFFQINNTNQKSMISIHYHYTERLGVGTKLANLHGQKGIVSSVKDLSQYQFWTASGKMVHPQILFSKQSLVGRTTSSQTLSMLNSPDLAVNGDGEICAPLAFFVHQIEANAKCKQMFPKNDLMTAENGFVANGLIATMNLMSKQYPLNESINENAFVLDLIKLGHVHLNLSPDLKAVQGGGGGGGDGSSVSVDSSSSSGSSSNSGSNVDGSGNTKVEAKGRDEEGAFALIEKCKKTKSKGAALFGKDKCKQLKDGRKECKTTKDAKKDVVRSNSTGSIKRKLEDDHQHKPKRSKSNEAPVDLDSDSEYESILRFTDDDDNSSDLDSELDRGGSGSEIDESDVPKCEPKSEIKTEKDIKSEVEDADYNEQPHYSDDNASVKSEECDSDVDGNLEKLEAESEASDLEDDMDGDGDGDLDGDGEDEYDDDVNVGMDD
ncbi:late expression factor 8 [Helicoverpa zea nudivirus 2]|uniref:DNA-directed RNA polymerase n=1 Tax=Helicoverpa zea nudivirus 2 TaxID=1128424 RepID=G9I077_HZNV2|nr:orf51 gene product [Helicoverpa zea nudivirus 2]AEW69600.1 late expression factor 8 [Helicoverpa zea nudivirus 2]